MVKRPVPQYFLYGEVVQDVDERFLHVETIPERSRLHDWHIRPHAHRDLSQLLFVSGGGGTAFLESDESAFRAPTLIRVPATCVHGFRFNRDTTGWVVTISGSLLGRITSDHPDLAASLSESGMMPLEQPAREHSEFGALFEQIAAEFRGRMPARRAVLEYLLVATLARILRLEVSSAAASRHARNADSLLVERFRALVEDCYRTPVRIGDCARQLCVGRERLRSACMRVTGAAPVTLFNLRRVLEAKRCLLYTNMTIAEVAYTCGFDDPAYFSRLFSQRTGESPRAFRVRRQTHNESDDNPSMGRPEEPNESA